MRNLLLLALGLALLSSPATAVNWDLLCDGSLNGDQRSLSGGMVACADPTSSSDDTEIIDVSGCENTDWFLFDDKDGDSTVCTVTWEVELCPASNISGSTADNACELAAGTSALSGDDAESNLAGVFMRAKGDAAGANAADCRLMIKCAQGPK